MNVQSLIKTKWEAVIDRRPCDELDNLIAAVGATEEILAYNDSFNPVIPTLLNDSLLKREMEQAAQANPKMPAVKVIKRWCGLDNHHKALLSKTLLSLFPEIDVLENVGVLNNLKDLYERQDRPDEF